MRSAALVGVAQRLELDFHDALLIGGEVPDQFQQASLAVRAQLAGRLSAGRLAESGEGVLRERGRQAFQGVPARRALVVDPGVDGGDGDVDAARDLGVRDAVLHLEALEELRKVLDGAVFLVFHRARLPAAFYFSQAKVEAWPDLDRRTTSPPRTAAL
ncbi:hypothetical protein STTU_4947 [Streptomyces sp. Tu6071]|nr:hypothetical protein STTU_4947 [Streptomyces sp. Tu6071]